MAKPRATVLRCDNCGAPLEPEPGRQQVKCRYCDAVNLIWVEAGQRLGPRQTGDRKIRIVPPGFLADKCADLDWCRMSRIEPNLYGDPNYIGSMCGVDFYEAPIASWSMDNCDIRGGRVVRMLNMAKFKLDTERLFAEDIP